MGGLAGFSASAREHAQAMAGKSRAWPIVNRCIPSLVGEGGAESSLVPSNPEEYLASTWSSSSAPPLLRNA
jgi:hypothetical protein